jgi:hypothetical protein
MDVPCGKWSTGALMRVIVPVALELVVFQDVWTIVLIPPVAIGLLSVNLGFFFALVRPRSWESRILGMLLGGIAAVFVTVFLIFLEIRFSQPGVIGSRVVALVGSRVDALVDPASVMASILRFLSEHTFAIDGALLIALGVAMILAGGSLDHWVRGRVTERRASRIRTQPTVNPPAPA